MDNQKIIIESLAMDLKRAALGFHRGSLHMAERFKKEALKRESELENLQMDQYIKRLLIDAKKVLLSEKTDKAEDILMYSTLFQNYAVKKLSNL